jgi:hypothetical protein
MAASIPTERGVATARPGGLRWGWILAGVLIASVLISLFLSVLLNGSRPRTGGFVILLSVVLAGILVGYRSRGETIRETAVAGLILVIVTGVISAVALDLAIPLRVWLASPLVVPGLAMLGGWTGELLQGTLEEAHEDRRVDWPWVLVSIVLGFTLSGYAVLVGRELMGIDGQAALWVFAGSFLVTGWMVGFFSPGNTVVEPAIAGSLMFFLDASFIMIWFDGVSIGRIALVGFGGGVVLALVGSLTGEYMQRKTGRRQPVPVPSQPY